MCELFKSYNSIIYSQLKEIDNFEIISGYYNEREICLYDEICNNLGNILECMSIDFFVHKITGKFNYGGECLIGKYNPVEGDLLYENVTELSVLTETANKVGVLTFNVGQEVISLNDVLDED